MVSGLADRHSARHLDDLGLGIVQCDVPPDRLDAVRIGGIHLIDDEHIGAAEVDFTGIVAELVTGAMRIEHHDGQVRVIERCIVVAAVPENHVSFLFCLTKNVVVVHSSVDGGAGDDMRFVLLALFDGAVVAVEIG